MCPTCQDSCYQTNKQTRGSVYVVEKRRGCDLDVHPSECVPTLGAQLMVCLGRL